MNAAIEKIIKKSVLWIVLLSFALPYLFAHWIYTHPNTFRATLHKKNNHGRLLNPALPLTQFSITSLLPPIKNIHITGPWRLIYFSSTPCDADCLKKVYNIRQIRTRLNEKQDRLERVLWVAEKPSSEIIAQITQQFPGTQLWEGNAVELQTGYLIADPHGNVILQFHPNSNLKEIYSDLKKLLTWSQIG